MRRHSLLPLLWLLTLDGIHTVHSQQQQQQGYERRRRRKQQEQRQEQEDQNRQNEKVKEFMNDIKNKTLANFRAQRGPKHVLEAAWNSLVFSGSLFVTGGLTMVGIPAGFVWTADTGTKPMGYVGRIIGGGIVGGLFGAGQWLLATVYGVVQLAMGIYATPKTIWAWILGKNVYNADDGEWRYYNITQEVLDLADAGFSSGDGNVREDGLYVVLGVETTATPKEIKKAYYKLARDHHPDKNPDSTDLFLKIHEAYETLYDEDRRRAYDELGSASFDQNSIMNMFDPGVFVDVFFGVSPELEHYIGDLTIKTLAKRFMKIAVTAQTANEDGEDKNNMQTQILEELMQIVSGSHIKNVRQVDIALYLQEFTHAFVTGNMSKEEYRVRCVQETVSVLQSTPFAEKMFYTIGSALYWEGGHRTVSNPLDVPLSLIRQARGLGHGVRKWKDIGQDLYYLVTRYISLNADAVKQVEEERAAERKATRRRARPEDEDEDYNRAGQIAMENLLPQAMDFVWKFNVRDIAGALEGACWKLLYSSTCPSRKKQASALAILGQTFLDEAKKLEKARGGGEDGKTTEGYMNIKKRFDVAKDMATKGGDTTHHDD